MTQQQQTLQKRWEIAPALPDTLTQTLPQYHPTLLQVLYNRGLTNEADIEAFLSGQYLKPEDPFLLSDMKTAVQRILQARDNDETIVVYGDFDADGVTATVLLIEALRALGITRAKARPYIPDRVDEGYGLNIEALSHIYHDLNATLVITVDCGIRSIAEVQHGIDIGLDMIITDHHSLAAELPPALAVINPKRKDCSYPEKMLAGVGIAYKLACALHQAAETGFDTDQLLDLVAIGTVADVMPLVNENRKLVMSGLEVLNKLNRPGISALAEVAGIKRGGLTSESIGFALGPRINAAGRLDHAYAAAKLLAASNLYQAREMAEHLNNLNRERQAVTRELHAHAELLIDDIAESHILIAADSRFLPGVVGLVAGRLKESYYRPAVVFEVGEEESHGSCRSIPEFHMTDALDQVADLLERYGGHAQAAGLTIRNENIDEFSTRMRQLTAEQLATVDLRPTLSIDAEIPFEDIDWALHGILARLEPTGCANVAPVFMTRELEVVHHRVVGKDMSHLQIEVGIPGRDRSIKGIGFGLGGWAGKLPPLIDLVYTLGVNEWRGRRTLQLMVQDIRESHRPN